MMYIIHTNIRFCQILVFCFTKEYISYCYIVAPATAGAAITFRKGVDEN